MKQKQTSLTKKRILIFSSLLFVIILVTILTLIIVRPFAKTETATRSFSFTFDEAKAPRWWAGDNNFPAEQAVTSDKHPALVQRTIAQGTPQNPGTCFVMYFYYDGMIDTSLALEQQEKNTVDGTGKSLERVDVKKFSMQTFDGMKELQVHQYNDTDASAKQAVAGIEFGYVVVGNGYIDIRGYCEKTEQLDDTLPVFSAVGLK